MPANRSQISPPTTICRCSRSKRPFAISDSQKTKPPDPVFFVDRDLDSPLFTNPLRAAGVRFVAYRERFTDPDVPDHKWLREVLQKGLVVLTHDYEMRKDLESKSSVYEHDGAVLIIRDSRPHAQKGELVVQAAPAIGRFLARHSRPFVAAIRSQMRGSGKSVAVVSSLLSADDPVEKWRGDRKQRVESVDVEEAE